MVTLFGIIGSAVVGFIAGVFVYRNNNEMFGAIADKIDAIYDSLDKDGKIG